MRCLVLLAAALAVAACAQESASSTGKREYAISDDTLGYSYAGGSYKPLANTPLGMVRDGWNDRPAQPSQYW
jgi:hypothetical protein